METQYVYSKKRSEFGKYCVFVDEPPKILENVMPNRQHQEEFILMDPVHRGTQCTTQFAEHEVPRCKNCRRIPIKRTLINFDSV